MKAAEVAARRGHRVTLAEATDRLGGRFNLVEKLGDVSNLLSAINWIEQELPLLGVEVLTQTVVDEAFIETIEPDAIILATGGRPDTTLPAQSDGSIPVISSDEAAQGLFEGEKVDMSGLRILFVDIRANYETALAIEAVAKRGAQVTVVTPYMSYGVNVGFTHLIDYLKSFPKLGVTFATTSALTEVKEGQATIRHLFSETLQTNGYDLIIAGTAPVPETALFEAIRHRHPTMTAGDMVAPRSALEAFREGDRCGRTV